MSSPLVTVIIPCYNHENYVEHAIISVLNQSYQNIELIVIDDGSQDSSAEIIQKVLDDKGSFRFIRQDNIGLIRTLNKGLELANGIYIAPLASDDIWLEEKIRTQVEYLEAHSEVVACFGYVNDIDQSGDIIPHSKEMETKVIRYAFDDILMQGFNIPPATLMYRCKVFKKLGGYDLDYPVEDLYSWLLMSQEGYQLAVLPSIMALYRTHSGNMHADNRFITSEHHRIIEVFRNSPSFPKAKVNWSILAFNMLSRNHKGEALKYLGYAIQKPLDIRLYKGIFKLLFRW